MTVFLEKPSKYASWHDLWNKVPVKLMIYIVELKDVLKYNAKGVEKTIKSDLVIKVEVGSAKVKTEDIKSRGSLVNQLLFIDVSEVGVTGSPTIEVRVKSGKQDVCEVSLGRLSVLEHDEMKVMEVDLEFPAKEKTKSTPAALADKSLGKLSVRLLLTCGTANFENESVWGSMPTIPPNVGFGYPHGGSIRAQYHDEKERRKQLKTGDLLLYQEAGLLGQALSLATSSPYSRVGMVVRLPDRYTGRMRPYVMEVTSNPQKAINVFTETPSQGIVLFRLWERLHSVQGGAIWWLPLLEPLQNDPMANMLEAAEKALAASAMASSHTLSSSSCSSTASTIAPPAPTLLVTPSAGSSALSPIPSSSSPTPNASSPSSSPSPSPELAILPSSDLLEILQALGLKDPSSFRELASASFFASLLRMGGKRIAEPPALKSIAAPKDISKDSIAIPTAFFTPAYLASLSETFGSPVPLRSLTPIA